MKKILFSLIVLLALVSCEKEVEDIKFQIDPNATITIRPAEGVKTRATISGLTSLEVVQQAVSIKYQSHYFDNKYEEVKKDNI